MTAFRLWLYLVLLASFLVLDAIWLGLVAKGFYSEHLGYLLAPEPNWAAAAVFYLLFVAAIQVFVVQPGLDAPTAGPTLRRGAFFGLVTYATYDLTNLATVRDWPLIVTLVDLAWGAALSITVGWVGYLVGRPLSKKS
jgi:uncharacterized membrane protein